MLACGMSAKKPPENPFAKLDAMRALLPSREIAPVVKKEKPPPKPPARAVVRFEKKGRGGKMVTVIEQLALPEAELERWCSELKKELGCGGAVEGDNILLQGDLRARLPAILTRRGVGAIMGNGLHK